TNRPVQQGSPQNRPGFRLNGYVPDEIHEFGRKTISLRAKKLPSDLPSYGGLVGFTQSGCRFDQCLEHRLEVEGRAADNLEHVGGRRLLPKGFRGIVGGPAAVLGQPRVVAGNGRLRGEIRDELDLLVRKRPDFGAVDDEGTNQFVLPPHGHADERASSSVLARRARAAFYRCVGSVDELFCLQKAIEGSSSSRLKRPALPEVLGICRRYA